MLRLLLALEKAQHSIGSFTFVVVTSVHSVA